MARWLIFRKPGRGNNMVEVYYHNLQTDVKYLLGQLSSDVSDDMIVEWVLTFGMPAFGDEIELSDGNRLHFQTTGLSIQHVILEGGRTIHLDHRASA